MEQIVRSQFDHIGIVTTEKKRDERWIEAGRVWVTSPREHPFHIEWVRFEDDSPVTGPTRTEPHVAYRVDNLESSISGHNVILEPTVIADGFVRVAIIEVEGALVEFMQYRDPDEAGWF